MPSFTFGIKLEHGGGEQMRGRMAKHLERVGILRGEDRKLDVVVERAREIHQFAIGARDERFFRQSRRDLAAISAADGAARHFASGAVWQSDLNGILMCANLPLWKQLDYWPAREGSRRAI